MGVPLNHHYKHYKHLQTIHFGVPPILENPPFLAVSTACAGDLGALGALGVLRLPAAWHESPGSSQTVSCMADISQQGYNVDDSVRL